MEIAVVALIVWEIHMGNVRETHDAANFDRQQNVLAKMQKNSQTTAEQLKILTEDQKTSLGHQTEMNQDLQDNLKLTKSMVASLGQQLKVQQSSLNRTEEANAVVGEQLKILKTEQGERVAEQNLRPILELWVQSFGAAGRTVVKADPNAFPRLTRVQWRNLVWTRFFVRNVGNTPAVNVVVTPKVASDVSVECLEQPWKSLGSRPEPCGTPFGQLAPIQPWPKDKSNNWTDYMDVVDFREDFAVIDMYSRVPTDYENFIVEISLTADRTVPAQFRVYCKLVR